MKGYILKESGLLKIVTGLRAVPTGKRYVSASLTGYLVQRRSRAEALAQSQTGAEESRFNRASHRSGDR